MIKTDFPKTAQSKLKSQEIKPEQLKTTTKQASKYRTKLRNQMVSMNIGIHIR